MSWQGMKGAAAVTAAAVLAAALTLAMTQVAERRHEREFAFRIARTTAAYIAAVTPLPPPSPSRRLPRAPATDTPRGYHLPQLLTNARALTTLPGWTTDVEVYHGTAPLVDATAPPLAPADLEALERGERRWRGGTGGALVPLLDREGRTVVGGVAARPRPLPLGPLPGGIGFALPAALLAVGAAGAMALRRRPLRRGGYAMAALVLAAAAFADVRAAARQSTDRWLTDTRRLLQEAATRLPAARGRVPLEGLSAITAAAGAEVVLGEPGESAPRRVRIDDERQAVVAVLIGPQRWVELRTVPAEDSTFGWLFVVLACAALGPVAIWGVRWAERTPPRERRETVIAWGFVTPAAAHIAVFSIGPLLLGVYLAVTSAEGRVNLANFAAVLRDPLTWNALRHTALYALYVPISAALALGLALVLHSRLLRSAVLLPYVSSVVAVALVWQIIFRAGSLGAGRGDWLSEPSTALLAIMALSVWVHIGGQAIVFLAAFQRIPRAYLDAARVDGAGPWACFRRVTLPLLGPTTRFVLVTGVIGAVQLFTTVAVLTGGGPAATTDVLAHRVYQLAWGAGAAPGGAGEYGRASALALLIGILVLVLLWGQLRLLGRRVMHA